MIQGRCHCGNISFSLAWDPEPAEIPARACGCTFCQKHGGVWTSNPRGALSVTVKDPSLRSIYNFGTQTADFHVCARCGMYCAAVYREGDRGWAVVNVNVLLHPAFDRPPQVVSYEGETAEARIARRKRMWTPLVGS